MDQRGKELSKRIVSGLILSILLLNVFALPAAFPIQEPHDANAMWIEPSHVFLSGSNPEHGIGYRFNVTVCINLSVACGGWCFRMLYDKSLLVITSCVYTAGSKSEFLLNISTIPVSPAYAAYNSTHNRVDFGESWGGFGPLRSPGLGTLASVEFEVKSIPIGGEVFDSRIDISTSAQGSAPRTYIIIDSSGTKLIPTTFDSEYKFLPDTIPPKVEILTPKNLTYSLDSVSLTFTVNESTAWMGYELDGASNTTLLGNTTLSGLPNGQHQIAVFANDTYGNMGSTAPTYFTIDVGVDLSVVSPDITFSNDNPTEGQVVTVSVSVYNNGGVNLQNVTVRFLDGNITIGEQQISSISYNSHITASVEWTAVGEGYHLMKILVDPDNVHAESDEDNNEATRSLLVGEVPSYGAVILTGTVDPSETYTGFSVRVFGDAVYNTTYGAGEPVAGADVTITIVGHSQDATHTVSNGTYSKTVTSPFLLGNYTLIITVTDRTFSTSVSVQLVVFQQEGVDLAVFQQDISFSPQDPVEGNTVNLTARIKNIGTEPASSVFVTILCNNNPIGNMTVSVIAGGGYGDVSIGWMATPPGWNKINVTVDPTDVIIELNENNNIALRDLYVWPALPDLTPTRIWFSDSSPLVGQTLTVYADVWNIGGIAADNFVVSFYDNEQLVGNDTIMHIEGKRAQLSVFVTHQFVTGGWHKICVIADPEDIIGEADENNNIYCIWVYVHDPLPDLTVMSGEITFSNSTPAVGDSITIYAVVRNQGEADASDVSVEFYDGALKIGSTIILPLVALGGQQTASVLWTALPEGWHQIKVAVDGGNSIVESNENNNLASRSLYVYPLQAADLCIYSEDIVFSNTAPIPGEVVTIYANVSNIGEAAAHDSVVRFYVDGIQMGSPLSIAYIPVGGSSTVQTAWVAEMLGSHVVKVTIDTSLETNKNNNNATRGIIVGKHDIAVSTATIGKPIVGLGFNVNITVCVDNAGNYPETFGLRVFANETLIYNCTIMSLGSFNNMSLTLVWNTSNLVQTGYYTLLAEVDIVPNETETEDNYLNLGTVRVVIPGDFNNDGYVGIDDIYSIASHFAHEPPMWQIPEDPIFDITNDEYIGMDDIYIAASHFGQEDP
jgi:subtilase family serine protease